MFLSPPEIQQQKLKSRLGSYDREEVDELLENIAISYEQVWRERDNALGRIAQLELQLREYQELERPLRDSLVTAQRAADELKAEAAKQAEELVQEAERKADEIVSRAQRERDQIRDEIARLKGVERDTKARCRALLVGALDAIGGSAERVPAAPDGERSGIREVTTPN
jgi:cell division initiation protein